MDLEFDKDVDALLRKAAGRGVLAGDDAKSHLDADIIAAFAENAVPVKSRTIYTQHLAECDPCRMSLANLISMNAAAEPAMTTAAAPVPAVAVPRYRKLFLAPNLAYVMGGLVLLFGGMLGLFVIQQPDSGDGTTLSKVEEPSAAQSAPARAEGGNSLFAANTSSNAATTAPGEIPRSVGVADQPMESNTSVSPPAPPPAVASSSDTAAAAAPAKDQPADILDKDKAAPGLPVAKEAPKREEDDRGKNEVKLAAAEQEERKQDANQVSIFRNQQNQMTPGAGNSKVMGPSRADIQRDNRAYDDRTLDEKAGSVKKTEKPAAFSSEGYASSRRSVGGKTFDFKQGAWYDSSYSGQKTKNVRRSSDDYRKLESGLQNITNALGGTVVVVWNGKAYRIQ